MLSRIQLFPAPWVAACQSVQLSLSPRSVQFSRTVRSDSLWPYGLQHASLPCSIISQSLLKLMSIKSGIPSNDFVLCHPLLLPSNFLSIRVFSNESALLISWLSTGASTSASVLLMHIQDWFSLGLIGLILLQSKGLSRVFSNATVQKHQFFSAPAFFMVQLSHPYMATGKTIAWTRWIFVGKIISLLFNMLSWS